VMAAAGNFALVTLATGGLYIGGGIAPRVLDGLQQPRSLEVFRARAPMDAVLAAMPVAVIRDPDAGLIGAAIAASGLGA
jgi:glucokinase